MKARFFFSILLALSVTAAAEAQKKGKKDPPKPPEPPKRVCNDGNPAADDGSCPEDFVRTCQDGTPAFEDGTCPEDIPKVNYFEVPFKIKTNIPLAAISVDQIDIGQAPYEGTSRISEGSHIFSVVFPDFDMVSEEIEVNADFARTGITKDITLVAKNEKARDLLSTDEGIQRFMVSGLTVDGFLAYQQSKKIRNIGIIVAATSVASFGGFTALRLSEVDQSNAGISALLTLGIVSFVVGAPATTYGFLKMKKAGTMLRDEEFRPQPPEAPEPEPEPEPKPTPTPTSTPASAPASAPAAAAPAPATTTPPADTKKPK